jgi:hypothetical protein
MKKAFESDNYVLLKGIYASAEQLASYDRCVHDPYMGNGTRYKRFSKYKAIYYKGVWTLELLPARAYTAPRKYNAVAGGISRKYEPLQVYFSDHIRPFLTQLNLDRNCV